MYKVNNMDDFKDQVNKDPQLQEKMKKDPVGTLNEVLVSPLQTDKVIYRIVVSVLGAVVLIAVIGGFILASDSKPLPEAIVAIASSAGGGLIGLLAPSPRN